jgi:hypothetical protein
MSDELLWCWLTTTCVHFHDTHVTICKIRGPEMASGAGHLIALPGVGKSHRTLWQVPEKVWKLWKNIGLSYERIRMPFCFHLPYFLTFPCKISDPGAFVSLRWHSILHPQENIRNRSNRRRNGERMREPVYWTRNCESSWVSVNRWKRDHATLNSLAAWYVFIRVAVWRFDSLKRGTKINFTRSWL